MHSIDNFLYPKSSYRGKVTPENLIFNANLQEFAQKINYVCNLAQNGKLSLQEAYQKIDELWQILEKSRQYLERE